MARIISPSGKGGSGAPSGVYADIAALEAAYPVGNKNVYVTLNDGNWNYWNGTAWAAGGVYQASVGVVSVTDIINDTTTGGADKVASAETVKTLDGKITNLATNAATATDGQILASNGDGTSEFITQNSDLIEEGNVNKYFTAEEKTAIANGTAINDGAIKDAKMGMVVNGMFVVGGTFPAITKSGATITVTFFEGSTLYMERTTGGAVYKVYSVAAQTVFTLLHNQVLIWNLDTNTVMVQGNNDARPDNNIMLLSCYSGYAFNGKLMPYVPHGYTYAGIKGLSVGDFGMFSGQVVNVDTVKHQIQIPLNTSVYYNNTRYLFTTALNYNYKSVDADYNAYAVYFDTVSKTIVCRATQIALTLPGYVLLGYVDAGAKEKAWLNGKFTINGIYPWESNKVQSAEGRAKIITGFTADQGMTVVGENIWVFRSAADNHSSYGNIEVYDKDTFTNIGNMTQNLGHCATVDYCPATDTLVTPASNLTYGGVVIYPEIQLVTGVSSRALSSQITYADASVIKIPLFVKSGETLTKYIGRTGIGYTFGETEYILYGHSMLDSAGADDTKHVIYKILLGMGANNYSDATGTDLTKWGTFASGKTDSEYNGTAKIVATYTGLDMGTSQGLCYFEGNIYLAVTSAYNAAEVIKLQLNEDGTFTDIKRFRSPAMGKNGSNPAEEAEGCAILDGRYLICGYRGASGERLAIFPLTNEMGGKGTVGTQITLPFACNSIPQIQITPTSSTADLYISQIDTVSFTISSVSNGTGTFIWSCKIS